MSIAQVPRPAVSDPARQQLCHPRFELVHVLLKKNGTIIRFLMDVIAVIPVFALF